MLNFIDLFYGSGDITIFQQLVWLFRSKNEVFLKFPSRTLVYRPTYYIPFQSPMNTFSNGAMLDQIGYFFFDILRKPKFTTTKLSMVFELCRSAAG